MSSGPSTGSQPKRKRINASQACTNCRRRKIRCSGEKPACKACRNYNDDCQWAVVEDGRKPASRRYVQALRDRVGALEKLLRDAGVTVPLDHAVSDDEEIPAPVVVRAEQLEEGDAGLASALLHVQLGDAGGEVHYHNPASAFAHTSIDRGGSPLPHELSPDARQARDYTRFLPPAPAPQLSPQQHHHLLSHFFRYFSPWTVRVLPDPFYRDMKRTLASDTYQPTQSSAYSPFLHNCILIIALALLHVGQGNGPQIREPFIRHAEQLLRAEMERPTLATINGLAIYSSVFSSTGRHTLGWAYMGLAERLSLAMGLNVDCKPLVLAGKMAMEDESLRNHTYWSLFCQDQFWSLFVGRPYIPQSHSTPLPTIDAQLDASPLAALVVPNAEPSMLSSAFHHTCKLAKIIARLMTSMYSIKAGQNMAMGDALSGLGLALDTWVQELPVGLNVQTTSSKPALPHIVILQLAREVVSMMIYRPFYRSKDALPAGVTADRVSFANRRCLRSARRALALLKCYREHYGLRHIVPFMMVATFTTGSTILLAKSRSADKSDSHLVDAMECAQIMAAMSGTFPVAQRQAAALEDMIQRYNEPPNDAEEIEDGDPLADDRSEEFDVNQWIESILNGSNHDPLNGVFGSDPTIASDPLNGHIIDAPQPDTLDVPGWQSSFPPLSDDPTIYPLFDTQIFGTDGLFGDTWPSGS